MAESVAAAVRGCGLKAEPALFGFKGMSVSRHQWRKRFTGQGLR